MLLKDLTFKFVIIQNIKKNYKKQQNIHYSNSIQTFYYSNCILFIFATMKIDAMEIKFNLKLTLDTFTWYSDIKT